VQKRIEKANSKILGIILAWERQQASEEEPSLRALRMGPSKRTKRAMAGRVQLSWEIVPRLLRVSDLNSRRIVGS